MSNPKRGTDPRRWAWALYAPALILAGALLGHWFPGFAGRAPERAWREAAQPTVVATPPGAGTTSLAPIVDRVRRGVVRISTLQRQVGEAPQPTVKAGDVRYVVPTDRVDALGIVHGSGFLVHEDGLIVTSHHVVASPAAIRVELPGHTRPFDAELLGEDIVSDLAVLRLTNAPAGLQALSLGDSHAIRQGDRVFSLGNPFEFGQTLAVGWVTYVDRHVPEDRIRVTSPYLQFSAPVNPGDSGAAVFDLHGHVIGMTRRTLVDGRGISFAVPSAVIKGLLASIERGDARVRRGYLGMEFQLPKHPEQLRGLLEEGGGAEVTAIITGHPADVAGIRVGDVILTFDGEAVADPGDLYDRIIEAAPGTQAAMSVVREGEVLAPLTVVVGEVGKHTTID